MVPLSKSGRLFCMTYSLLGIPLCMITLASLGKSISIQIFTKFINISKKYKITCFNRYERLYVTAFILLTGVLTLLVLPGVLLTHLQEWTLLEATYFILISLTTIGFGDYIPRTYTLKELLVTIFSLSDSFDINDY